jgi:hypothetical protein
MGIEENIPYFTNDNNTNIHKTEVRILHDIQGYRYRWLKSYLSELVKENMKFALCVDISRVVEVKFNEDNRRHINLKRNHESKPIHHVSLDEDTDGTNSPLNQKSAYARANKRFTMLSKSMLYRQSYDTTHTASETMNMDASTDMHMKENENSHIADALILNCPILSPMLFRCFSGIWWDISPMKAITGICECMFSKASSASLISSNDISNCNLVEPVIGYGEDISKKHLQTFSIMFFSHTKNFLPHLSTISDLGIFESYGQGNNMYTLKGAAFAVTKARSLHTMKHRNGPLANGRTQQNSNADAHRKRYIIYNVY